MKTHGIIDVDKTCDGGYIDAQLLRNNVCDNMSSLYCIFSLAWDVIDSIGFDME